MSKQHLFEIRYQKYKQPKVINIYIYMFGRWKVMKIYLQPFKINLKQQLFLSYNHMVEYINEHGHKCFKIGGDKHGLQRNR